VSSGQQPLDVNVSRSIPDNYFESERRGCIAEETYYDLDSGDVCGGSVLSWTRPCNGRCQL
jgi:hypothetical protein